MSWSRVAFDFIVGTLLSVLVFCTVSSATVMWCISPWSGMAGQKIEIGFPIKFYYLYVGLDLHGFAGNMFIKEALVYWAITTTLYLGFRHATNRKSASSDVLDSLG